MGMPPIGRRSAIWVAVAALVLPTAGLMACGPSDPASSPSFEAKAEVEQVLSEEAEDTIATYPHTYWKLETRLEDKPVMFEHIQSTVEYTKASLTYMTKTSPDFEAEGTADELWTVTVGPIVTGPSIFNVAFFEDVEMSRYRLYTCPAADKPCEAQKSWRAMPSFPARGGYRVNSTSVITANRCTTYAAKVTLQSEETPGSSAGFGGGIDFPQSFEQSAAKSVVIESEGRTFKVCSPGGHPDTADPGGFLTRQP